MESISSKVYDLHDSNLWLKHLEDEGYAVIQNVLDEHDYESLLKIFEKEWKEMCPNFDFQNIDTWTYENVEPLHSGWYYGMVNGHGFGQSDFQWGLRTNSRIIDIWKKVHNTEDLVVSFDGLSIFLSYSQEGIRYHTDQHPNDSLYSIQGAYNFYPVGMMDSGFIVVPKSHKTHKSKCPDEYKFITVEDEDPHLLNAIHLQIPKNCFVLWNSKTIHSSIGMDGKTCEWNRLTSYLSYFPKSLRSETIKNKRIEAYKNGINCSHYAIYHHPKQNPRNQKKLTPLLNKDGSIPPERLKLI